jgi:hypothetical protein
MISDELAETTRDSDALRAATCIGFAIETRRTRMTDEVRARSICELTFI